MRRLSDRFDASASCCNSLGELRTLLLNATRELGFDYVAMLHHETLTTSSTRFIRIDNYPKDWVCEVQSRGLASRDPVHLACRSSSGGFEWSELHRWIRLGRTEAAILEESRRFGIGSGFTVPANVPGEPCGSCSFAVRVGKDLPRERLLCAELVGLRAFEAARRLTGYPGHESNARLSPREVQCLRLVAAGKSDFEISVILGISVQTASQYVKHARHVYDAVSRAQLVALGLRDGWLSFDDARGVRD